MEHRLLNIRTQKQKNTRTRNMDHGEYIMKHKALIIKHKIYVLKILINKIFPLGNGNISRKVFVLLRQKLIDGLDRHQSYQ